MEVVPWLVTFVAGQATGLGIALAIAWVERRWRRQEVRAAEKRARLEERFESVRQYAAAVREFVHECIVWMDVWEECGPGPRPEGLAALVESRLENRWHEVQCRTPQGEPWYLVGDMTVKEALLSLVEVAQACQDRCSECVEAGELMSEQEVSRFLAEGDENLEKILERMDEAVEAVES